MDVGNVPQYQYVEVPQQDAAQAGVPLARGDQAGFHPRQSQFWTSTTGPSEPEQENARLAASVLFGVLANKNPCRVEVGSVYGPAIVMPQFARSTGYHRRVTELALRSLFFVLVNIGIQGSVLWLFSKEQVVMDKFAGRMALCDFGATIDECPNAIGCIGPGGTEFEPLKRFPFARWMNVRFLKESFDTLFPDQLDDIADLVQTGEYGVESSICRLFCCLLYMMALTKDAFQIYELWRLLWHVPTRPEPWISYDNYPAEVEPELHENRVLKLDEIKLRIAGMPCCWKVFNIIFIMVPKTLFWYWTADLGITFLMNTSDITDSIVNSMALAFILNIDELIFETATAGRTKFMMDNTEPYHLHDISLEDGAPEDVLASADEHRRRSFWCPDLFPQRLLVVCFLTWLFLTIYYYTKCERGEDGSWRSKPLYFPTSLHFGPLTAYFPFIFKLDVEKEPVWTMPVP